MPAQNTLLTVNLTTKTVSAGSGAWTPPTMTFGEHLTLSLAFQQSVNGNLVDPGLNVTAFGAALGAIDRRPQGGLWALQIGDGPSTDTNTTAPLDYACSAAQLAAAINALTTVTATYGAAKALSVAGSYLLTFANAARPTLSGVNNLLQPVCRVMVSQYEVDGKWINEIRLMQSPVAYTDSQSAQLPPPPVAREDQPGGTIGGTVFNEIQTLYVPPTFAGSYVLKWNGKTTTQLGLSSTYGAVQAALQAIGANVTVTASGIQYLANIEFVGTQGGSSQPLIVVDVVGNPPGNLTFTLPLDRAELYVALRNSTQTTGNVPSVTLPLDVRVTDADLGNLQAFILPVTVLAPVVWPDMALVPAIDWTRPLSPINYNPFSRTAVLDGQKFYPREVGDGAATVFNVDHPLHTEVVFVWVRENVSAGRQLVEGVDYTVHITNADSVAVTALTGAPGVNAWFVTVMSAQSIASFANGLTVEIAQVTGLSAALASITTNLATLNALAPTTPIGATSPAAASVVTMNLPQYAEVFPPAGGTAAPSSPGALLPAIHTATVTSLTTGDLPDPATHAGQVYQNNTGAALYLAGSHRLASSYLAVGEYAGSNGDRWFPMCKETGTTSYFPRDFARYPHEWEVNAQMLRAGTRMVMTGQVEVQLLNADVKAEYWLVVECAQVTQDISPATTAPNLAAITNWTRMLAQRVVLSNVAVTHGFGVEVIRAAGGGLTANKTVYGYSTAADACPASAEYEMRWGLVNFDVENAAHNVRSDAPTPTGAVSIKFNPTTVTIG